MEKEKIFNRLIWIAGALALIGLLVTFLLLTISYGLAQLRPDETDESDLFKEKIGDSLGDLSKKTQEATEWTESYPIGAIGKLFDKFKKEIENERTTLKNRNRDDSVGISECVSVQLVRDGKVIQSSSNC